MLADWQFHSGVNIELKTIESMLTLGKIRIMVAFVTIRTTMVKRVTLNQMKRILTKKVRLPPVV